MNQPQVLLDTKRFKVVRQTRTAPHGGTYSREYVQHPGAVTIVPLLPDGRLCLVQNYRLAVGQTLLELPAGTLDPGEAPQATARRELEEETGYRAGELARLCEFFMSPGILSERMHVFLATELEAGPPRREPNEEIENVPMTLEDALAGIDRGQIQDAKTIAALLFFERWRRGAALAN